MTLLTGRIGRAASALLVCLTVVLATGLAADDAEAQTRDDAIVIAVPDVYPGTEGVGFILRTADARRPDVIIMKRETLDAAALDAAVALLRKLRDRAVPAGATEVTTVQGFAPHRSGGARRSPQLERALQSLTSAPRVRIGNVGQGRWLELRTDVLQ